jgi:hypothetical protein
MARKSIVGLSLAAWMLALAASRPGFSQAVSGYILGTVTDRSGAAVPNARITVTDLDRGTVYTGTTSADGNYSVTHLLAGRYQVKISAPGFADFVTTAEVLVDNSTRVDAALEVGKAKTELTVTAQTPLLKTDRADVSVTLTGNEVEKLPVLNRNLTELVLEMPGAAANPWQHASSENPQGGIQIDVNGQYFFTNGFLLDGTENMSSILGIAVINPNLDSLQEFKVTTSNYDAEFGNVSGALIQATTKSGTNQLHGSLFEFLRNNVLNSSNPFTGANPPLRWNQFGGSVGGPLRRDKLFGFFDYQGTRRRTGGSLITTVPTAAERAGDLSALLGSYICADGSAQAAPCSNPLLVPTTEGTQVPAQAGMVFDPTSGNPDGSGRRAFSSGGKLNQVPVAAPMARLLATLPAPNFGPPGAFFNNYVPSISEAFDTDQYDVRIDDNFSDKSHLFGRYTLADFNKQSPGAYGAIAGGPSAFGFAGHSIVRNQSLSLGWTYTLTPTLITEARFGTYRYRVRVLPNGVGTTPAKDAGLPGLNLGTIETSGMPAFTINGDGGFAFGYSLGVNQCNCPLNETENHFQWVNNWTKFAGNHTIKWGADVRRAQQQRIPSDDHRAGEMTFASSLTGDLSVDSIAGPVSGATTGEGLGAYLLGLPSSFDRFIGSPYYPGIRQTRLYLFGQDSWRITSKLTLNYGLRYENYRPQTAAKPGGMGMFDPTTGDILAAGIGQVPRNLGIQPYNAGFAPRLGVAYQLNERTVIRAGYGHSYNASGLGAVFGQNPDIQPPIVVPQSNTSPNPYTPAFPGSLATTGPPLPVPPPVGPDGRYKLPDGIFIFYYVYPLDSFRIPLAQFWNLTLQREIRPNLTAEVAYVGNVGRHLYVNPNTNQAVPGPGDFDSRRPFFQKFGLEQGILEDCNCDNSSYHALQAKLQQRVSHGLDFLLTYTYSRAMTNTEGSGVFDNNYNWRNDHGPASFNRTHQLTLLNVWDLPFGKGRKWAANTGKWLDALIGGWSLDGVTTLASGIPFTPQVSSAPLLNADFNGVRPDIIGNPHVANPNRNEWFNPNAYVAPRQPFRDGQASRDSLWGPAFYVFDLALAKTFVIAEGKTLEFRWENFNAFNIDNLGLPANLVDVAGAGQITRTQTDMRQMQFGLHLRF